MPLEDIFRAYDIRGRADGQLTPQIMQEIGQAYGTYVNTDKTVVGHDVRETSPELSKAFIQGVTSTGVDVLDTGFLPYGPVLFAGWQRSVPSAFITASHLSKEWNGVKFAHENGIGFTEEENMDIADLFFDQQFSRGNGSIQRIDPLHDYGEQLMNNVDIGPVNVLMDCGNGSAAPVAPPLFEHTSASVDVMNGKPDGSFPNRSSDVTKQTLEHLRGRVHEGGYDMGVAYDGDADRVAVVDDSGRLLDSEQLAAVMLHRLCEQASGPIVANVECSRLLEHVAKQYDRKVIRVRVGHTYLFQAMQKHDACLGVEKSGHMGVPHVLPLDDGIAASLYAAEVVSQMDQSLSDAVDALPHYYQARIPFKVSEQHKFDVIRQLQEDLSQEYANTTTIDGIRVDFDDGWVLIRASNTSPKIRLTIEAENNTRFQKLQNTFNDYVREIIIEMEQEHAEAMEEQAEQQQERESWKPDVDGGDDADAQS